MGASGISNGIPGNMLCFKMREKNNSSSQMYLKANRFKVKNTLMLTANREENFTIRLNNNPPNTMSPMAVGYKLCNKGPKTASAGKTLFVQCSDNLPPTRYVIIVGLSTDGLLNICEVEVYGKGKH
jgi:hypothetical protein